VTFNFYRFLNDKLVKDDIESSASMGKRLTEGYKCLEQYKSHLLFCHAGVVQQAFIKLGIKDFMVLNCGVASFEIDQEGITNKLIGFWEPPKLD
jgi:hypothetical protein